MMPAAHYPPQPHPPPTHPAHPLHQLQTQPSHHPHAPPPPQQQQPHQPQQPDPDDHHDHRRQSHQQQQHQHPNAPPDLDIPTPREGSTYADFEALRFAVNSWALRDKFLTRIHKKDQTRAIYQCRHFMQGCPWKLRATINKDTGVLTVSSVVANHTCSRDVYEDADGKPKYAKRGVQHTQRWVKDVIQRAGFHVTLETEPRAIVDLIRERFGEEITDRLAAKSKQSLLEARGEAIPRRPSHKQPGPGPNNNDMADRQRDMQVAMEESRRADRMNQNERPFVFESGVRVIGPASPPRTSQRRQTMPATTSLSATDYNAYNTSNNTNGFGNMVGNAGPGPSASTASSTTGRASALPVSPAMVEQRPCPNCSGSGMVRANAVNNRTGGGNDDDNDELALLQKQVALIGKQIALMQRRRANGAG
ncbi:Transposase MuDR plant [Lasiodiplodia theobromae]|nr:Transposase MuDR plant [Lasiodiplodia theobromae]